MRVIVTAGGTREAIDDVRFLTNVSTGRFGYEVASAFHLRGCDVVLLAPGEMRDRRWYALPFDPVPFEGVVDLEARLHAAIAAKRPDALLMAAAVSDYVVAERADGKLSSEPEEMTVRLRKAPKILAGLRDRCGAATYLVGFKLLSGVAETELRRVAEEQTRRDRLDLTVANDLALMTPQRHPMWLSTSSGEWTALDGPKSEVARRVADYVLEAWSRARQGAVDRRP